MHTNTSCKYRKKLLASPRVHLVFIYCGFRDTYLHHEYIVMVKMNL